MFIKKLFNLFDDNINNPLARFFWKMTLFFLSALLAYYIGKLVGMIIYDIQRYFS